MLQIPNLCLRTNYVLCYNYGIISVSSKYETSLLTFTVLQLVTIGNS